MDRDKDRDPSRSCFIHYFHLFSGFWLIAFCANGDEQTSSETEAPDAGIESGTVSPANAVTLSEAGPSQSEASGPLWVSPSLPSSPSPSWFEGADNYSKNRFGDQGEVSSSAPVESPTSLTLSNQELMRNFMIWGGDLCWTATWPFSSSAACPPGERSSGGSFWLVSLSTWPDKKQTRGFYLQPPTRHGHHRCHYFI